MPPSAAHAPSALRSRGAGSSLRGIWRLELAEDAAAESVSPMPLHGVDIRLSKPPLPVRSLNAWQFAAFVHSANCRLGLLHLTSDVADGQRIVVDINAHVGGRQHAANLRRYFSRWKG